MPDCRFIWMAGIPGVMVVVGGLLAAQAPLDDLVPAPVQEPPKQQPPQSRTKFIFQVSQSFDAKYFGDLPGHIGKGAFHGGEPDVAMGDPVYRDNVRIGVVTGLKWDWTRAALEVEFDPEPFEIDMDGKPLPRRVRVTCGQDVWIPLGGRVK